MMLARIASFGLILALGALAVNATLSVATSQTSTYQMTAAEQVVKASTSVGAPIARAPIGENVNRAILKPRKPHAKRPSHKLVVPEFATGRLIVKFHDSVLARPTGTARVQSLAGRDLRSAQELLEEAGGRFVPLFEQPFERLRAVERRAEEATGKAQPDLAGMMFVEGIDDHATLQRVARRLNDLAAIEYVVFEVPAVPMNWLAEEVPVDVAEAHRHVVKRNNREQFDAFHQLLRQEVNAVFGLHQSIVEPIELPPGLPVEMEVMIPVDGVPARARLWEHTVWAPDFQLYESPEPGVLIPVDIGPERSYRGELVGFPGSRISAALLDEGLYATVLMPDGRQFSMEPVRPRLPHAPADMHVVYHCSDAIDAGGMCGTNVNLHMAGDHAVPPDGHRQGGVAGNGCELFYAEIALDLDFPWVDGFASTAQAGLIATAILNTVNLQYEADVDITHVLTAVIARTTPTADPYTTTNANALLTQFTNHWNNNHQDIRRDVAHLLTGRSLDPPVIGIAWLNAVCSPTMGYGLSQRFQPFACQTDLVAHELGHNWGAAHCDCSGVFPEDNWTMNPFITCANKFNPDFTIPTIAAFRDFLAGFCLDCDVPPADGGCGFAANDCFTASADPYCDNSSCCGAVCAVDPSCCDDAWHDGCVAIAQDVCFDCGDPGAGSCFEVNLTPGCDDDSCCDIVIGLRPSCEAVWDEGCVIYSHFFCNPDFSEPTPDLTPFQAYLTATPSAEFDFVTNWFYGETFFGEGHDLNGLFNLGEELLAQGVGEENLTRGKTVRVAAIEGAFYPEHEDLDIIQEPGQTMWLNELVTAPSHGTAVLGIMSAVDNGFGMRGIAPDAEAYFFPSFSLENGGRLASAVFSAIDTFGPGDVINMSIGLAFGPSGFDCAEGSQLIVGRPDIFDLVTIATALRISVVISAGNMCCNLDETGIEDSGAFVISACDPGLPYCRRDFSNFTRTPNGSPPHFSAWGIAVATTGGNGDLWSDIADGSQNRSYTATFGGTSAAAPMIAGAVACIQGLVKQFYSGWAASPLTIRGVFTFFPQCGLDQPSPDLLGTIDDPELNPLGACAGDETPQDDDPVPGVPNYIAGFPLLLFWAIDILELEFFPDIQFSQAHAIRGEHLDGDLIHLSAIDGLYYVIRSEPTSPASSPSFVPPGYSGPLGAVTYRAIGQTADLFLVHEAPMGQIVSMDLVGVAGPTSNSCIIFMEVFDWDAGRWSPVGLTFQPAGADGVVFSSEFLTFNPHRFVHDDSREVLIRFWAYGFPAPPGPGGSPGDPTFNFNVDLVAIDVQVSNIGDDF